MYLGSLALLPWDPLILPSELASGSLSSSVGLSTDCPLPGTSALRFGARQEANSFTVPGGPQPVCKCLGWGGTGAQRLHTKPSPTLGPGPGLLPLSVYLTRQTGKLRPKPDLALPKGPRTQSCRARGGEKVCGHRKDQKPTSDPQPVRVMGGGGDRTPEV